MSLRKVHGTQSPLFADEAPTSESRGVVPVVRSQGGQRDDEVHPVWPSKLRFRTREECIDEGRHVVVRDDFTGLHYCRWCGFPE